MPSEPTAPTEFSRIVLVDGLAAKARTFAFAADSRERAALARRFDILEVARLDVAGEIGCVRGGTVVQMTAHLSAEVTQACVVTLVPVRQVIEADFARLYTQAPHGEPEPGPEVHFDEADDDIDPLFDGRLDVGEAAAEQLALELDPYPRAPEAELGSIVSAGDDPQREEARVNPFADLASLSTGKAGRKKRK